MADHSVHDLEPPRRLRRGPPPRLYVIARQSPVPWLQVRRLGEADRAALGAHLRRLAAARQRTRPGPAEAEIATGAVTLDVPRLIAFGAIAGNAIIAVACGVPGPLGLEVGVTEDPDYLEHDLGTMLVSQVLGAQPGPVLPDPGPEEAEHPLLCLVRALGGRVERQASLAAPA